MDRDRTVGEVMDSMTNDQRNLTYLVVGTILNGEDIALRTYQRLIIESMTEEQKYVYEYLTTKAQIEYASKILIVEKEKGHG